MTDLIQRIDTDEAWRREAFPSCRDGVFFAHAAVAQGHRKELPRVEQGPGHGEVLPLPG